VPAVSKARTPSIAQLARELGYASKPTLIRHLARIDELAPQIEPEQVYPQDWIVFRVTGYRPDINDPELIPGDALRGDLSALAESISEAAGLSPEDIPAEHESIDSLANRWGVSRKTIERYRRLGLIARRIDLGSGRRRVVFLRPAVEWFETMHHDRLGRAARFDRIGEHELTRFDRWARGYRARLGWSCSQCAMRIAARSGHSHEGVRKALLRIDAQRTKPIFDEPGPAGDREGMIAIRASLRGIEPRAIARRSGRRVSSIGRAARVARVRLLRDLGLPGGPVDEAGLDTILDSAPLRAIPRTRGDRDLSELISTMRAREPSVAYEEQMRARAVHGLVHRCGNRIAELDLRAPSGSAIDAIETDLRLVTMLETALLRSQLTLVLSSIESRLGGPIDTLAPTRATRLVMGGIGAACGAIGRNDPTHGGRIAAPIGLAVNRFAATQPDVAQPVQAGKATRRIAPGHSIPDWTRTVSPWQGWLDPDPRIADVLDRLDERDRVVLVLRFGLGEHRPVPRESLAQTLNTTRVHAARFERAALRNALGLVRGGAG
jgi:RNA polymerase primary sigma factor